MSASREKNKRKNTAAALSEPAAEKKEKKGMNPGLKKGLIIAAIAVCVVLTIFFTMFSTGFAARHTTAWDINGHKVSAAEANFYYGQAFNTFQETYGDYAGLYFDTNQPLNKQIFDPENGLTWADYFESQGKQLAASAFALSDAAEKEGFQMSSEERVQVDNALYNVAYTALTSGFGSSDALLAAQYGAGCNTKNYEEYLTRAALADAYSRSVQESYTFSDDEIEAEYSANRDKYDGVNFRLYNVNSAMFASEDGEDSEDEDAIAEKVEALAAEMVEKSKGNEQVFIDMAYENAIEVNKEIFADPNYTLKTDISYSSVNDELAEWLFSPDRQEGDTASFENSYTGQDVLYFVSRDDHDFNLINVRHILVSVEDSSDADAMAQAEATAKSILEEFEETDKTESDFAALAMQESDDSTASEGGLMESVIPGTTVANFNNWCYGEKHEVGDTGIVSSDYGYHIIYFCGETDENYQHYLVEYTLRSNDYSSWGTELLEDYPVTERALGKLFVSY